MAAIQMKARRQPQHLRYLCQQVLTEPRPSTCCRVALKNPGPYPSLAWSARQSKALLKFQLGKLSSSSFALQAGKPRSSTEPLGSCHGPRAEVLDCLVGSFACRWRLSQTFACESVCGCVIVRVVDQTKKARPVGGHRGLMSWHQRSVLLLAVLQRTPRSCK